MLKQLLMISMVGTSCGSPVSPPSEKLNLLSDRDSTKLSVSFEDSTNMKLFNAIDSSDNLQVVSEFGRSLEIDADTQKIFLLDSVAGRVEVGRKIYEGVSLCAGEYSEVCELVVSKKFPNQIGSDAAPVVMAQINLNDDSDFTLDQDGLTDSGAGNRSVVKELLPFVLPSPNQEDAGSCLFMASTGAMEIFLNKNPSVRDLSYDGNTDLSERFLMNAGPDWKLDNWLTDSILVYNHEQGGVLNRDFRYTKNYFKKKQGGNNRRLASGESSEGANYGTKYNWIDEVTPAVKASKIKLPKIKRTIIYSDPQMNQWNAGIMDRSVITKIKQHLDKKSSPVMFVYNHFGYWHAVVIVGYNDNRSNGRCPFVRQYLKNSESDPRQSDYVSNIKNSMDKNGGCSEQGVFYVRDSIYEGDPSIEYDYDLKRRGDETPYSKAIVEHSYEWALYMGNHAYSVELAR